MELKKFKLATYNERENLKLCDLKVNQCENFKLPKQGFPCVVQKTINLNAYKNCYCKHLSQTIKKPTFQQLPRKLMEFQENSLSKILLKQDSMVFFVSQKGYPYRKSLRYTGPEGYEFFQKLPMVTSLYQSQSCWF